MRSALDDATGDAGLIRSNPCLRALIRPEQSQRAAAREPTQGDSTPPPVASPSHLPSSGRRHTHSSLACSEIEAAAGPASASASDGQTSAFQTELGVQ